MKVYILNETQNLMDYNEHEMFRSYDSAKNMFNAVKATLELQYPDAEVLTDDEIEDEYYIDSGDVSIRLYITEFDIN